MQYFILSTFFLNGYQWPFYLGSISGKYQALGRSAIGVDKPSQRWGDGRNMQMFYFYF
jgi:hypothetical protein